MNSIFSPGTPAALGYAMPPEWAPHQATWFSWPHNRDTWPDCLERAEQALAGAVAALTEGERVRINVLDERHERHVAGLLAGRANPQREVLHRNPTSDAWWAWAPTTTACPTRRSASTTSRSCRSSPRSCSAAATPRRA